MPPTLSSTAGSRRRVARHAILPAPKPQQHQMKMLLPRRVNPMIKNLKVECPFDRFNLLPRHWHQHRIQVHRREPRQNLIGLCGCPRRRISKLAPKNQIRLTIHDQLHRIPHLSHCRQRSSIRRESANQTTNSQQDLPFKYQDRLPIAHEYPSSTTWRSVQLKRYSC